MDALPVIRYPAGIISWPKEEIEVLGRFHPKSSTRALRGGILSNYLFLQLLLIRKSDPAVFD